MSGAVRWGAVLVLVGSLALTGCTDDTPSDPPGTSASSGSSDGETTARPDGPSPQELSEQILAAADEAAQAPAIGSATGALSAGDLLTMEVLAVQRLDDATFVQMRWSAPELVNPGFLDVTDLRRQADSLDFARTLFLEDPTGSGQRLLPLQFTDYRSACTCPLLPIEAGPDPQLVTAVYPALPAGTTTVDLRLNRSEIVVTGLPVS
jgi:hypothetical protein